MILQLNQLQATGKETSEGVKFHDVKFDDTASIETGFPTQCGCCKSAKEIPSESLKSPIFEVRKGIEGDSRHYVGGVVNPQHLGGIEKYSTSGASSETFPTFLSPVCII